MASDSFDIGVGLRALFEDAKKSRETVSRRWEKNLKYFKGDQKNPRRHPQRSNTVTNFLFSECQTILPVIADPFPEINTKPYNEKLTTAANSLAREINRILKVNDYHIFQATAATHGMVFGKAWYKATWNPEARDGLGDARIEVPDSRSCFMEPGKISIKGSNYFFESRLVDMLTLLREYPERQKDIIDLFYGEEASDLASPVDATVTPVSDKGANAAAPGAPPASTTQWYMKLRERGLPQKKPQVELVECYLQDDQRVEDIQTMMEPENPGEKPETPEDATVPMYPSGRVIVIVGDKVFDDRPNGHPEFPYIEYTNYIIPGEPYGMGEIDQGLPIQDQYNLRQNQIFDFFNYNIAPLRLYERTSGIKVHKISNNPSQWIPCINVNGVRELSVPRMGIGIFESLLTHRQNLETIFGVREVTQGAVPGEVRSGAAIEFLQEAANSRLRQKSRYFEVAMKDLARYLTRLIAKFYIDGVHFDSATDGDLRSLTPDMFEYEVKAGANLPSSRAAQELRMQWMFSQGIIDEQYVVDNIQLPGKEALVERMKPIWEKKRQLILGGAPPQGAPAVEGGL